jgi:predicted DNA-binding protein (MmcQ/YjbR family)
MEIEVIRDICNRFPSVTEEIKWGNDLCFSTRRQMFCAIVLDFPLKVSFKVPDEEFEEIASQPGIVPAPYAARHKWVLVENASLLSPAKWLHYISQSYNLVSNKLSKKKKAEQE